MVGAQGRNECIESGYHFQFTVFKRNEKVEAIRLPAGHADSYRRNKAKLKRIIILYCPVMRRIVDYWYREFRLVSTKEKYTE